MTTLIFAIVLSTSLSGAPAPTAKHSAAAVRKAVPKTRAARLESYILNINKKAKPYAALLAQRILVEAKRHHLDPAMFAAIAYNESWFNIDAKGTWFEAGIWQLWPWAPYLAPAYYRMRATLQNEEVPDADWSKMSRKQKTAVAKDIRASTFMAAYLLAYVTRSCRRRSGRMSARCAARYNRPAAPRLGYSRALRRRSRRIRKVLEAGNAR